MAFIGPDEAPREDFDRKMAAVENLPLFMKSLPTDSTDDVAVQALAESGARGDALMVEIAQNFKEQGNDYFKGKRYREAMGFYTQGIDAKPTDNALLEGLLCNRAACNLELQNYGSVLRDCSRVLNINPESSKAYYRSAVALLCLDRSEEALDCCDRCLSFDTHNQGVKSRRRDRKQREKEDHLRKERDEERALQAALEERHLYRMTSPQGTSANPYSPHFDPEDTSKSRLIFPHATSDVISDFAEDTAFSAHLSQMFPPQAPPPSWDLRNEYAATNLVVYAITRRKRLLRIGKKMTLGDVCRVAMEKPGEPMDGLELKDGYLTFAVLPKGEVEQNWVEEFKRTRGGE
ncbi:hypothetical protein F5J12DRAFT_902306 [Pisolithus orientalis]|uniref:uncharacterized protein n=1 Tax=Pisolithus orientalis TaxID=936130 RepID=UPI00222563D2|nr:uncharacterized protein F5J12DRAFT_902306 [Pisolithus orientalis]KAI6035516.1 hypothetical protein F5J12DRAFT_902306 [Pisolithus orientalis]